MVDYKRGRTWSKKYQCSSREVSVDGCLGSRVSVTEKDIVHFCLSQSISTAVEANEGSSLSLDTM